MKQAHLSVSDAEALYARALAIIDEEAGSMSVREEQARGAMVVLGHLLEHRTLTEAERKKWLPISAPNATPAREKFKEGLLLALFVVWVLAALGELHVHVPNYRPWGIFILMAACVAIRFAWPHLQITRSKWTRQR